MCISEHTFCSHVRTFLSHTFYLNRTQKKVGRHLFVLCFALSLNVSLYFAKAWAQSSHFLDDICDALLARNESFDGFPDNLTYKEADEKTQKVVAGVFEWKYLIGNDSRLKIETTNVLWVFSPLFLSSRPKKKSLWNDVHLSLSKLEVCPFEFWFSWVISYI